MSDIKWVKRQNSYTNFRKRWQEQMHLLIDIGNERKNLISTFPAGIMCCLYEVPSICFFIEIQPYFSTISIIIYGLFVELCYNYNNLFKELFGVRKYAKLCSALKHKK